MQGTPVTVMLQRTFRCRHFSHATEARDRRVDMLITSWYGVARSALDGELPASTPQHLGNYALD
jgi:hypothetical protein